MFANDPRTLTEAQTQNAPVKALIEHGWPHLAAKITT